MSVNCSGYKYWRTLPSISTHRKHIFSVQSNVSIHLYVRSMLTDLCSCIRPKTKVNCNGTISPIKWVETRLSEYLITDHLVRCGPLSVSIGNNYLSTFCKLEQPSSMDRVTWRWSMFRLVSQQPFALVLQSSLNSVWLVSAAAVRWKNAAVSNACVNCNPNKISSISIIDFLLTKRFLIMLWLYGSDDDRWRHEHSVGSPSMSIIIGIDPARQLSLDWSRHVENIVRYDVENDKNDY